MYTFQHSSYYQVFHKMAICKHCKAPTYIKNVFHWSIVYIYIYIYIYGEHHDNNKKYHLLPSIYNMWQNV
jgi:hypothetical protein